MYSFSFPFPAAIKGILVFQWGLSEYWLRNLQSRHGTAYVGRQPTQFQKVGDLSRGLSTGVCLCGSVNQGFPCYSPSVKTRAGGGFIGGCRGDVLAGFKRLQCKTGWTYLRLFSSFNSTITGLMILVMGKGPMYFSPISFRVAWILAGFSTVLGDLSSPPANGEMEPSIIKWRNIYLFVCCSSFKYFFYK